MNELCISVCNMGSFLTRKQFAKEAEVEKVHIQENFEMLRRKCNYVRVLKFNEKWKDEFILK